ncbi:MAG: hypothetical protein IPP32_05405 [Bacteroidetes bacterium]|nr:hypothetical protein [Bacteroidota bacterium]
MKVVDFFLNNFLYGLLYFDGKLFLTSGLRVTYKDRPNDNSKFFFEWFEGIEKDGNFISSPNGSIFVCFQETEKGIIFFYEDKEYTFKKIDGKKLEFTNDSGSHFIERRL